MAFLRFLESIRTGFGDFLFSTVTHIGEETFFLVFAILFFWCISKREGYFILMTGMIGNVINQFLKVVCRVPRPWLIDTDFKPVSSAIEEATGYSFPSGHTQNVAGTFGAIGSFSKKRRVKIVSVVVIVLVAFSRMYLGVHTPMDVAVSLVIAGLLVLLLHGVFKNDERFDKLMDYVVLASVILAAAFTIFVFTVDPDTYKQTASDYLNLLNARKNAATFLGCLAGLALAYPLDKYLIKFETEAKWYSQVIKLVLGLGVVLVIKSLLKDPLNLLFGNEYIGRAVRYFLIVIFAGTLWPLTFTFFKNLSIPFMDRFTAWFPVWVKGLFADPKAKKNEKKPHYHNKRKKKSKR